MPDAPLRCPRCGGALNGAPGEACPACLLQAALAPGEAATMLTPVPDGTLGAVTSAGVVRLATPGLAEPTQIGPYRIVDTLGEGGMGVVYLAEQDEPIKRRVALKLIKLGMDTREVVARFEAERQALALMEHPHIAAVLDAGATIDGRPYFIMEYAPGVPITEYCDRHQLGTRARLDLFIAVCAAVQHAHQKGIIHRDLKPSNVLVVEQDGTPVPKVIDFGIAKATDQQLTEKTLFTQHGLLIGTPEYMSPEQAGLGGVDVDTRTDIYALGVILYELLVGSVPFSTGQLREAGYGELLRVIREDEPRRPSTQLGRASDGAATATSRRTTGVALAREVRGDLDWITLKALEKDRARRYQTASELAADLTRHLGNEPVVARPPSVTYRAQKFVRRNRLAVTAAALVAAALITGLVATTQMYFRAERERLAAVAARGEAAERAVAEGRARSAAETAVTAEAAARAQAEAQRTRADHLRIEADDQRTEALRRAYVANIASASANIDTVNIRSAQAHLSLTEPALRGWEWGHLNLRADPSLFTLEAFGRLTQAVSHVPSFAFSADGRRMFWNNEEAVHAWDLPSFTPSTTVGGLGGRLLALRPDGAAVLIKPPTANAPLRIVAIPSREVLVELADSGGPVAEAHFSADATHAVASFTEGDVRIWNAASGRARRTVDTPPGRMARAAISPDCRRLYYSAGDSLILWDLEADRMVREFRGAVPMSFVESPAGKRVAVGGTDGIVRLFSLDATEPPELLTAHRDRVLRVVFSRGGDQLVSTSYDGSARLWDLTRRTTLAVWAPPFSFPAMTSVAFDPTGRRVVTAAHASSVATINIWDATARGAMTTLPESERPEAIAFSPNGKALVATRRDGTLAVWKLQAVAAPVIHRLTTEALGPLAFHPMGRFLATAGDGPLIRIVDPETGDTLRTFDALSAAVTSVAFNASGSLLASTGDDRTARIWDVASRRLLAQRRLSEPANAAAFPEDDDARLIIGFGDRGSVSRTTRRSVEMWNWRTNQTEIAIDARRGAHVGAIAVNKTGTVAIGGASGAGVFLWDRSLGRQLVAVANQDFFSGTGNHFAFTPDGRRLVTSGVDGTARVWDVASGDQLAVMRQDGRASGPIAVSPDGSTVASSDRVAIYLWMARSADEIEARALVESLSRKFHRASEIVQRIRMDPHLSASVRERALARAATATDDPEELNRAAWLVVVDPARPRAQYREAAIQADAAAKVAPWRAEFITTLGLSHYRIGEYGRVIQGLPVAGNVPTRQAIAAMAHWRLGQGREAQALLDTARKNIEGRAVSEVAQLLMKEAAALIERPVTGRRGRL